MDSQALSDPRLQTMSAGTALIIVEDAIAIMRRHAILSPTGEFQNVSPSVWATFARDVSDTLSKGGLVLPDQVQRVIVMLPQIIALLELMLGR